jgi:hypothetical protein
LLFAGLQSATLSRINAINRVYTDTDAQVSLDSTDTATFGSRQYRQESALVSDMLQQEIGAQAASLQEQSYARLIHDDIKRSFNIFA